MKWTLSLPISSIARLPLSSDLPLTTTVAPCARNPSAMPRPMPRVPPVITATRFSSEPCAGVSSSAGRLSSRSVAPPPLMRSLSTHVLQHPVEVLHAGLVPSEHELLVTQRREAALNAVAGQIVLVHDDVMEPVAGVLGRLALVVVLRLVPQREDLLGARGVPGGAGQHERDDDLRAPTAGHREPREQPVDRPDAHRRVPGVLGRVRRVRDRPERERVALVRPPAVEGGHVGEVRAVDRGAVQGREVVTLEVAVDDHLPVRPVQPPGGVVVGRVEPHRLEERDQVRPQPGVQIDGRLRVERDEDDAGAFGGGQRHQAHLRLVDPAVRLLGVDAGEAAGQVVAPRVVRAGEPVRAPGALADQLRAAVPAHVDHGVHLALPVAGDQHRRAGDVDRLVRARLRQLAGQRERQRRLLVHGVDLALPQLRVAVVAHRLAPLLVGLVGGLVAVVLDQAGHHVVCVLAHRRIELDAWDVRRCCHRSAPPVYWISLARRASAARPRGSG